MAQDSEARKRVPSVIYTTTCYIAFCGPVCVPLFDMNNVSLEALAQQLIHCLHLSLWTQNPRAPSSVVRAADCRIRRSLVRFLAEVMVYLRVVVRQSDESYRAAEQHHEPNQNTNHNDYKKVSQHGLRSWLCGSPTPPGVRRTTLQ